MERTEDEEDSRPLGFSLLAAHAPWSVSKLCDYTLRHRHSRRVLSFLFLFVVTLDLSASIHDLYAHVYLYTCPSLSQRVPIIAIFVRGGVQHGPVPLTASFHLHHRQVLSLSISLSLDPLNAVPYSYILYLVLIDEI